MLDASAVRGTDTYKTIRALRCFASITFPSTPQKRSIQLVPPIEQSFGGLKLFNVSGDLYTFSNE